jgi:hypothetical protein
MQDVYKELRIRIEIKYVPPYDYSYYFFTFQEFLKLYPKCMESSRSLYSKLQSVEKDEAKAFITSPVRSNSTDYHQMAPPAPQILEKSLSLPEPIKAVKLLTLKPLSEVKIKEEPSENVLGRN